MAFFLTQLSNNCLNLCCGMHSCYLFNNLPIFLKSKVGMDIMPKARAVSGFSSTSILGILTHLPESSSDNFSKIGLACDMDHQVAQSLPRPSLLCFCFKCCVCNCFCHFLSPLVLVLRQILLHQIEEDISVSPLGNQFMPIIGQFHNRIKSATPIKQACWERSNSSWNPKCMTLSCFAI